MKAKSARRWFRKNEQTIAAHNYLKRAWSMPTKRAFEKQYRRALRALLSSEGVVIPKGGN